MTALACHPPACGRTRERSEGPRGATRAPATLRGVCYAVLVASTANLVREKARRGLEQLPHLWRALGLVWAAAPRLTLAWGVLTVVLGLLPVASVFLTRALVDSLVGALGAGAGWERARGPLLLAAAAAGVLLLTEVLQALSRWLQTAQSEVVRDDMSSLLQAKAIAVDLEYYESAQYFDQLHLIRHDVQQRPLALLRSVGGMVQHLLTLASMLVVLARFGLGVPILLVVSTVPAVLALTRYMVREYAWRLRALPEERRAMYFDYTLTGRRARPRYACSGWGRTSRRSSGCCAESCGGSGCSSPATRG